MVRKPVLTVLNKFLTSLNHGAHVPENQSEYDSEEFRITI